VPAQLRRIVLNLSPELVLLLRNWKHRRGLREVQRHAITDARVQAAFAAAAAGEVEPAAAQRFAQIEARRLELMKSRRPVTVLDFGVRPDGSTSPDGIEVVASEAGIVGASHSRPWAELLFQLIRQRKPERCLEMGTCCGITAAYIGAALELNGHGRLVTLEGAPHVARLARATLERAGQKDRVSVIEGPFARTLETALAELAPVEFIFVDGHHDGPATRGYFDLVRRYLAPGAMVVFDDIRWSASMSEAWRAIAASPDLAAAVDAGPIGVVLMRADPAARPGAATAALPLGQSADA
jgi:predicted O-methyltransferase YrrM